MKLGIGIDTGGTYTDGVIYDFEAKTIMAKGKALTTSENLSVGIGNVLDKLPLDFLKKAEIVSLSTTLATNACVEEKGGRGKLIFIGADKDVVERTGKTYGLPDSNEIFFLDGQIGYGGEIIKEPLWDCFLKDINHWVKDAEAVGIVQQLGIRNSTCERKVKELIHHTYGIQAVCGYELFSDLNYIKRGASTLLNARLIPVIESFLIAIKTSLKKRHINAPVVIVRSDGSLMSEKFTTIRPVETLLSGPAASVIGGMELSKEENAMIVDMGGTTTDMAIVKEGMPVKTIDGVKIGKWKTFVKSVYIDTFGLGGDSFIRYNKSGELILGSSRVTPLCIAAQRWPKILEDLKKLLDTKEKSFDPYHEFVCVVKKIQHVSYYSKEELNLYYALKDGPLTYRQAGKAIGKKVYSMYMERLEKEGIIMRCGLTPTDVMHIKDDFNMFNKEASFMGAEYVSGCMGISVECLCEMVYDKVKERLYFNIIRMLLENKYPKYREEGLDDNIIRMIHDSWKHRRINNNQNFINMHFTTSATVIGVGAPIHIFLPDVAKALGAKCAIPEHASVANAVGAVVGNISATSEIDIRKDSHGGFTVFCIDKNVHTTSIGEAIQAAKEAAIENARQEVVRRGALGEIAISVSDPGENEIPSYFEGRTIIATAVGKVVSGNGKE
ncbi:MAG: hydantoinase/oxoprolinase family protein [Eubacteriales bacterium]